MVELKDISLSYAGENRYLKNWRGKAPRHGITNTGKGETAVLSRVNACFEEKKFSAVIGPSGCGKTSLIKIIAGLIAPNEGSVFAGGSPLGGVRRNTAVIFQDYGLLPWKTVGANAELPLRIGRQRNRAVTRNDRQKVEALLDKFGLGAFIGSYPKQLSGGMKQRLAIVRALTSDPDILLMDEPFSSLDALTREDAQEFFLSVMRERPLTVIMVTHSIEEAVYLADFVYVMNGVNPGSITGRTLIAYNGLRDGFRDDPLYREYCSALRRMLKNGAVP